MSIEKQSTDEAILGELGSRLARNRLDQNQTQAQLAEKAGVSKRTVERLESGQSVQLSSFIRVCRELDLIKRLDSLIPEPTPSPMAQIKLQGKMRRRATSHKTDIGPTKKWTWGDES
jgi:transcriptional regulator with XRE-family HTH domain